MNRKLKRVSLFSFGALLLLVFASLVLRKCGGNDEVAERKVLLDLLIELREELEYPGIDVSTAASNLQNPENALEFVRNETILLSYPGTFADPAGVLRSRAANPVDRCRLLEALLESMGWEARVVAADLKPEGEVFPGSFERVRPEGLERLADYLDFDLGEVEAEFAGLRSEYDEAAQGLRRETEEAFTKLSELVPDLFDSGEVPKPLFGPEERRYWVQFRRPGQITWTEADPTYDTKSFPGNPEQATELPAQSSESTVFVEGVRGDGSRRTLLSWTGEAVGRDLNLFFLPGDRNPCELFDIREPNEIWAWAPVLQVGRETFRGTTFSPDGALMANMAGSPAVDLVDGKISDPYAPPVSQMKVLGASCGDGKRVRIQIAVEMEETPRWHAGHFSVTDNGEQVRNLRMESVHTEPRPVILVIDTSGSMDDQEAARKAGRPIRAELAQLAARQLIESLPKTQSLALISHGDSSIRVARELAPLTEGDALQSVNQLQFGGKARILGSINEALALTSEPSYVVFLTDGIDVEWQDAGYQERLDSTKQALRDSDSALITVGIGEAHAGFLTSLSTASGTSYLSVDDVAELPSLYAYLGNVLSGAIELSYAIPGAPVVGDLREVEVTMDGFSGKSETEYEVREGQVFGFERIEMSVLTNPYLSPRRTIVDFSTGYDGWRMMGSNSIWITPSVYPQHIVESRLVDGWIEALLLNRFVAGGEMEEEHLARSFSHEHAATVNALYFFHSSAVPDTPPPVGPTILRSSVSLRLEGENLIRSSRFDRLVNYEWPVVADRRGMAKHYLGLNSAEAALFGSQSVNRSVLEADELGVYRSGSEMPRGIPPSLSRLHRVGDETRVLVIPEKVPVVGWDVRTDSAAVYGYIADGYEIAKGASAEEVAAEFNEIRSMLQLYSFIGGNSLSMVGSPAGGAFSALCVFYDRAVRLYCYSAVMMNQVTESIGTGEFDAAAAQKKAADLCEVSQDSKKFARDLGKDMAKAFAKKPMKKAVKNPIYRIALGAASAAAKKGSGQGQVSSGSRAMPVSSPSGRIGKPTAVSSPSLSDRVVSAIAGEEVTK